MTSTGYRAIADDLRAAITRGDYPPGTTIPTLTDLEDRYAVGKETVRRAVNVLRAEGLVVPVRRRGTVVRDRTPVRLTIDRYADVLVPGHGGGPWETACSRHSIANRTELITAEQRPAPSDIADELDLPADELVIYRHQHMYAGVHVGQMQESWLPLPLVAGTILAESGKVVGGLYRALTSIGHPPASAIETVQSRMPTQSEAEVMNLDVGSPVLAVERITRGRDGRAILVTRAVAVGDRVQLSYGQTFPIT